MKKTTKVILGSTMTIAMCASLIAGSTLAMFSSRSNVNVAITSGKVDVVASVDEDSLTAYSTVWNEGKMQYEEVEQRDDHFHAGGFYSYSAGALTFTNIAAGDAVEFKLNIENKSTLAIQYRVQLTVPTQQESGDPQGELVKEMQVSFDGGDPVTIGDESTIAQKWSEPVDASAPITTQPTVKISVPAELEGNQGESCLLHVGVYAVQLGTHVADAEGTYNAHTAADLLAISNLANSGHTFAGETIELGADIDLSFDSDGGASTLSIALADTPATIAVAEGPVNWFFGAYYLGEDRGIPVYATGNNRYTFKGTFNGNGYTITGFAPNDNGDYNGEGYGYGLFRSTDGATIENLVVESVTVQVNTTNQTQNTDTSAHAGIIVGQAKDTTFKNITVRNSKVISLTDYNKKIGMYSSGATGNRIARTVEEAAQGLFSDKEIVCYDFVGAIAGQIMGATKVENVNIDLNEAASALTGIKIFGNTPNFGPEQDYYTKDYTVAFTGTSTVVCTSDDGFVETLEFTSENDGSETTATVPSATAEIGSADALVALAQSVTDGRDFSDVTITLTDDIDLSEAAPETIGAFKGIIDGGEEGHTISGLDLKYFSKVASPVSLMSVEEAPTLKNVTLEFTKFTGEATNWRTAYAYKNTEGGISYDASFVSSENLKLENATIALVDAKLRYELRYGIPTEEGNKLEEVAYIGLEAGDPETGEGYSETITNQHIIIDTATPVTYNNVRFEGNTYIWIQTGGVKLSLTECYADVSPSRVGGNSRAAFITSSSEITGGVAFTLVHNTILSAQSTGTGTGDGDYYSAAIFSWAYTADSNFIDNRLGSEAGGERYTFIGIKLMNFMDGAQVEFSGNKVYGNSDYWFDGFDLMQNNSRANTYTATFTNNQVFVDGAIANQYFMWVEATGTSVGTPGHGQVIVEAGNTLNGAELTDKSFDPDTFKFTNVATPDATKPNKYEVQSDTATRTNAYYQYSFVGWKVTRDDEGLINAGTFAFGVDWNVEKLVSDGFAAEVNSIETFDGTTSLTKNQQGQIVLASPSDILALNAYVYNAEQVPTLDVIVKNNIDMTGVELTPWSDNTKTATGTIEGNNKVIYGLPGPITDSMPNTVFFNMSGNYNIKNLSFVIENSAGYSPNGIKLNDGTEKGTTLNKAKMNNVFFLSKQEEEYTWMLYCYNVEGTQKVVGGDFIIQGNRLKIYNGLFENKDGECGSGFTADKKLTMGTQVDVTKNKALLDEYLNAKFSNESLSEN